MFWGRWGTAVPLPGALTLVVGAPMRVEQVPHHAITAQQVEHTHARFVAELKVGPHTYCSPRHRHTF